jgi:flagellar motor switch protein FliN/FliY
MSDKTSNVRLVDETASVLPRIDQSLIAGVEVTLEARLGSAVMTVAKLMELKAGDCVPLDAQLNSDVEIALNGVTVARGELVAVGDSFGVRITEIARK